MADVTKQIYKESGKNRVVHTHVVLTGIGRLCAFGLLKRKERKSAGKWDPGSASCIQLQVEMQLVRDILATEIKHLEMLKPCYGTWFKIDE